MVKFQMNNEKKKLDKTTMPMIMWMTVMDVRWSMMVNNEWWQAGDDNVNDMNDSKWWMIYINDERWQMVIDYMNNGKIEHDDIMMNTIVVNHNMNDHMKNGHMNKMTVQRCTWTWVNSDMWMKNK